MTCTSSYGYLYWLLSFHIQCQGLTSESHYFSPLLIHYYHYYYSSLLTDLPASILASFFPLSTQQHKDHLEK